MYITNNNFLQPTYKNIRPYECSMVVVEGPNTIGKISLQGLEIPYDTYFVSKMILNSGATNKPLSYGFLGNDVTYIMIKVSYDDGSKIRCSNKEKKEYYIEYFFSDNPNDIRPIGQLMILTGGSNHRLSQIYINNPLDIPVVIEVLVASAEPVADNISNNVTEAILDGLYYNSLITNEFASGCTQFEIINENNQILLVLPLDAFDEDGNIQYIEQTSNILTITTENNQKVILKFLTYYDACQAHSRFNWIFENPTGRYLTKDLPLPDLASPIITLNTYAEDSFNTSGITKDLLRIYYIDSVHDDRDGVMSVNDVDITIRQHGSVATIPEIIQDGIYDIIFKAKDIANNETTIIRTATFDSQAPVITFKQAAQVNPINMSVNNDSQAVPSQGLTQDDIRRYCIDKVVDNIDGVMANSAVTLQITGTTFPITLGGIIPINFSAEDKTGNINTVTGKTLNVIVDIPPILSEGLMMVNPVTGLTGGFNSGYTLQMSNNSSLTYLLQLVSGATKDHRLENTRFPFYIINSSTIGITLYDYYQYTYESGATQDYLLDIANGNNPLFYIMNSNLLTGLTSFVTTGTTSGVTEYIIDSENYNINNIFTDLQLRGDYPEGEYYLSGEVVDIYGNVNTMTYILRITYN